MDKFAFLVDPLLRRYNTHNQVLSILFGVKFYMVAKSTSITDGIFIT